MMVVGLLMAILTALVVVLLLKEQLVSDETNKQLMMEHKMMEIQRLEKEVMVQTVKQRSVKGTPLPKPAVEAIEPIDPLSLLENENYIRTLDQQIANALQVPTQNPVVYNDIYNYCEFCNGVSLKPDMIHNPNCPALLTI